MYTPITMDRLLTQQLRIFYLKRKEKNQNLYLYTQLSLCCSTKPNHFFILFISPFSLSFIFKKEIHHRFSIFFPFPKLNYRFRFAAGRASLIHFFFFFFIASTKRSMFVQTDVYSPPSLTLLLLLHIFVLQVDRRGGR